MEEKKIYGYRSFGRKLRFSKQAIASFGFRALEALFVCKKSFFVNQNDKKLLKKTPAFI